MIGQTTVLEKSVKCTAAIAAAYTIGKFGADDDTMSLAAAAADSLMGVFQHTTSNPGEEVHVMLQGVTRVKLGGAVTRGAPLTSDASGQAVAAAPAAASNARIIGIALANGASGDIIPMLLAQSVMQG
ncbi:MAG TPA: capsid cement protein [Syntrophorhabdaceae bacterium]|jgi:hypothetical protein